MSWVNSFFAPGRCMFCGLCAQVCPVDAITMSKDYELSVQDRDGLVYTKTELATIGGQLPDLVGRHCRAAGERGRQIGI